MYSNRRHSPRFRDQRLSSDRAPVFRNPINVNTIRIYVNANIIEFDTSRIRRLAGVVQPSSRSAQTPAWSEGHSEGSPGLGLSKHTPLSTIPIDSDTQM